MIVLDTNIISELMRAEPHPAVLAWVAAQPRALLYTTHINQAEILYGIAALPEGRRRAALAAAAAAMFAEDFAGRILPFEARAAARYPDIVLARRRAGNPIEGFDALIAAIHRQPLRWHLIVIIGQPGDPTHDATIAWPAGREQVDVGTLTLDRVESDETSAATDINFDPLVLPAGIKPSDDPLLSARSAVYAQSFRRRAGETKQPSGITPADVRKGD